jgi:hypothetical protein
MDIHTYVDNVHINQYCYKVIVVNYIGICKGTLNRCVEIQKIIAINIELTNESHKTCG